ncbi:hypothetical protein HDU76_012059, partial [Blyttiomyces sp. JEL0837]
MNNRQFGRAFGYVKNTRDVQQLVDDPDEMEAGSPGEYFDPDNPYKIKFFFGAANEIWHELLIHIPMRNALDLEVAASEGNLELAQWLAERVPVDLPLSRDRVRVFGGISSRHITLLRWLRDQTHPMYSQLASKLLHYPEASHGTTWGTSMLEMVKFIHEAGVDCRQTTFDQYVLHCCVNVVEYLLSKRQNASQGLTIAEAARKEIQEMVGGMRPDMMFGRNYHFDYFRDYFNIFPNDIDKQPHIDASA